MSRTTIADVARVADVSKATVSRVLAGQSKYIREETRQRVQKAVEELGYRPSDMARSLKSKRSCTLGIVGYGLEFFGPSCTISGIEQEASELGYTLLLHLIRQPETNNVEELLERMQSRYVDGIIWAVPEIGENHAWLENKTLWPSVPIIFLSTEPRPDRFVAAVDNHNGGLMATRHLIAQGCQNIGLITGPWAGGKRANASSAGKMPWKASAYRARKGSWSKEIGRPQVASMASHNYSPAIPKSTASSPAMIAWPWAR